MASLALGVAGAIIGNMLLPGIGGSIGFALGSALGSALDPQKIKGPTLNDLKVQGTSYGTPIPIVYGSIRIAGCCVLWKSDLTPHEHKSGGKGGPQTTTTTYSCSFAIQLCQGPIDHVQRVWADNRLVYENGGGLSFVTYLGSEDQLPDPTGEALLGVGNVPAHRGTAYVSFADLDLTDYGNRIPNFTFEVVKKGSASGGLTLIEHNYTDGHFFDYAASDHIAITYWPMSGGNVRVRLTARVGTYFTSETAGDWYEFDRESLTLTTTGATRDSFPTWYGIENDPVACSPNATHWLIYPIGNYIDAGGNSIPLWAYPKSPIGTTATLPAIFSSIVQLVGCGPPGSGGNIPYAAGVPSNRYVIGAALTQDGKSLFLFCGPNEGWTGNPYTMTEWYEIRGDVVVRQGTVSPPQNFHSLGFGNCDAQTTQDYNTCQFENNRKYCWQFHSVGTGSPENLTLAGGGRMRLFEIDSANNFALIPFPGSYPYNGDTAGGSASLGDDSPQSLYNASIFVIQDGYCGVISGDNMGVFTRFVGGGDVTLLSEIVTDLSERAGLDTGQIEVSELTDIVHGYVIARQSDVRSALVPLQTAYFFDAVESGELIKFPKRGKEPVVTIIDDELAAHEDKSESPPLLTFVRAKEVDLPRRITTTYFDQDAAYQNGAQIAQRMVTQSLSEMSVELPIAMTSSGAKQIADRLLWSAWYERDSFTFTTARKYCYLEPTDAIIAHGRSLRISTREEQPNGIIKWTGVQTIGAVFTQEAGGVDGGGQAGPGGQPPLVLPQDTDLELLDIAYIADPTRQNVYWAAMAGASRSSWRGAALYRAKDAINYDDISESHTADIIGSADTVLGEFLGGNVFDEVNSVEVTIGAGGGELSSTTRAAILDGANEFVLGSEILQARDAVLVSESTYQLTGFLRGRRGTEWAMATHVAGERFVVLPTENELSYATSDIGLTRQYKAVTFGNTLASAVAQNKTLRGVSMTPYSPVFPSAGINAAGDWILQWVRRARVNGAWLNFTDVPLDEPSEQYRVTLWTDLSYLTVAADIDCTVPTTTVTAAQQTAIFGSPQSELFWSVAQIGRLGPGYDTLGRAPTLATPPPSMLPTPPTLPPSGAVYLGDLHFDGSQTNSDGVSGDVVAYAQIAIPNPLPAGWDGHQTYVSIFESGSGTYAKRMWLSRGPFDYSGVYPAYGEGNGSANIYMMFNADSAYTVNVKAGEVWYLTIKNELPDGTPSCPSGANGNFAVRMYPPSL
jgi:hypothetical protein